MTEENRKAFLEVVESERRRLQEIPTSRPLPAVRDEHGEIKERTVKELLGKINEELDELKEETLKTQWLNMQPQPLCKKYGFDLAEEAADTITAITTMLEALGIDAEMRDEAQRRVNAKNRERGRL